MDFIVVQKSALGLLWSWGSKVEKNSGCEFLCPYNGGELAGYEKDEYTETVG